jgi:hypothetical protein
LKKALFISLFAAASTLGAQHFGPIANGQYAGVHATKINPALTAYSAYNWHVNIVGAWGNVNNNFLSLHLPYSIYRLRNNSMPEQYKDDNGNPIFDTSWLHEHLNGLNKHAAAGAMIYGPSFTVKIKNFHIGLVTEATGLARISGLDESIAHALYKELDTSRGAFDLFKWDSKDNFSLHRTTISANAWMAVGANVSYAIPLEWKQQALVGITLKKVFGFGGGYLQWGDMIAHRVNNDSITLNRTNIRYSQYGNNGRGTGLDIGAAWVYHKPEYKQAGGYKDNHSNYFLKLGFSLLDIGRIRYREAYTAQAVNNRVVGWNVADKKAEFENQTPGSDLVDALVNEIPAFRSANETEYIGLPTRMAITADYQFKKHWYINGTWLQSMRGRYSKHARHQSYLMIAPRYEVDFFEFSLPVFMEYDYRSLRAGASLRLGPLYLGTNSLLTMIRAKGMRDADFYIGITLSDIPGNWKDRWLKEHENKRTSSEDCEKM